MVTQVASKAVGLYQGGSMLKGKEKSSTPNSFITVVFLQ